MPKGDLKLKRGWDGQLAQIWVESAGNGQLTSGTKTGVVALWCNDSGEVTITFPEDSENPETRTYTAGDMVAFETAVSVAITESSGTFSFMVQ